MRKTRITAFITAIMMMVLMMPMGINALGRYELIKKGDEDAYVLELQKALYDKGYLKVNPTGYFGNNTYIAVEDFQRDNGLDVDGIAGPETRKTLLGDSYTAIPQDRFGSTETNTNDKTVKYVLKQGDENETVEKVQKALKIYGYYSYDKITGYYGSITRDAVKDFQKGNSFEVTGALTQAELDFLLKGEVRFATLRRGDEGDAVKNLQERLRSLGYFNSKSTGFFGSATESAVKRFQSDNSLKSDGIVGKNTFAVLYSSETEVKKAKNDEVIQSEEALKKIDAFISYAKEQLGKPYVYGDEGPDTFDCSGLVYYCLNHIGYSVSRSSSRSYSNRSDWEDVSSKEDLLPGDLMFFRNASSSTVSHISIYIGDGKILHAIPSEGCVYISEFKGYWVTYFTGGKRVFK